MRCPETSPSAIAGTIAGAVRRAGVRAVVQSGSPGFGVVGDDVLTVGSVPHSWLFPQTAAVVHHCGAGTTAAGLRAGRPTVPVPVMLDQPFWARRLQRLGAATASLDFRKLAVEPLAARISEATTDEAMQARAAHLAATLAHEDGYAPVIAAIGRLQGGGGQSHA